jgi:hypothetical protein
MRKPQFKYTKEISQGSTGVMEPVLELRESDSWVHVLDTTSSTKPF